MSDKRIYQNKVTAYLKPKNEALFRGFASVNDISNSEAVNIIMKDFFNRLSSDEKINLISKSKNTCQ